MDLIWLLLAPLLVFVVGILTAIHYALAPSTPVKGKTNVPLPANIGITWPILGNALWFMNMKDGRDLWKILTKMMETFPSSTDLASFWLGRKLIIFVSEAKTYEELLSSTKVSNKDLDFYGEFNKITDGPFSRNGKAWAAHRVPLDKLMHPTLIQNNYAPVTAEKVLLLCDLLDKKSENEIFDMENVARLLFWDITMETFMGVPGTALKNGSHPVPHLMSRTLEMLIIKVFQPQYRLNWIWNLSKLKKEFDETRTKMRPHVKSIIDARYAYYKENQINPQDPNFKPTTYPDIAIKVARDEQLEEEVLRFSLFDIIGGVLDTPGPLVSTTVLFMAMHPEIQEKVYKEQTELMGTNLGIPSHGEISEMHYLKMAMFETLRIIGVPGFARVASSEIITEAGDVIPEGATIYFYSRKMLMSPEYWERPDEYYPEHFVPEKVAKRPKGVFLPWSAGPRMCPGKLFTMMSVTMVLSTLFRRYRFHTNMKFKDITYKYMLLLESVDGYPVRITKR